MPDYRNGYAEDGPRHGVRITAGPSWDGRILEPIDYSKNPGALKRHYPGRYIWIPESFDGSGKWVWWVEAQTHNRKPLN